MRIQEALARYECQLEADGRSEHTINQARRHVRLLDDWLGDGVQVEDVGHERLAEFLTSDCVRLRADGRARKPTSTNALLCVAWDGAADDDPAPHLSRAYLASDGKKTRGFLRDTSTRREFQSRKTQEFPMLPA